ncbi:hypothetical protein DV735_g5502, partial [Chaetothyriales sp. CBS 134920]
MSSRSLFRLGQQLRGKASTYRITEQLSEFVYFAVNQEEKRVVVKSVEGHWRLHNERDILKRFQRRTPNLRPLLDEIEDPAEPPAIVLKHLDDDLTRASRKQRLTRQEIKYVARGPSNILVNYATTGERRRFSDVQVADCGGVVSADSEFAREGYLTGTSVFRAPEVHLELPWGTASDIWSFGVTLIHLIWAFNFHLFEPVGLKDDDDMYDTQVVANQHKFFGPFPISYKEFISEEMTQAIEGIMSLVPPEKMKPFELAGEREISTPDKTFLLRIMPLDPRDRPSAAELLQDEWFTETSERTVGSYSREEWVQLIQERQRKEKAKEEAGE